jgi:prephenate dehydrogenase
MRWRKATLVGVGLLGGSLGQALKARALAERVAGYVRRTASIEEALRAKAVDEGTTDLAEAAREADLIVLCTPLLQMGGLARELLPHARPGAVVTDVGSVKKALVEELEPLFASRGIHFVGSHPMAGSEKMGVSAARPDLFEKACCVVTPTASSNPEAVRKVEGLWTSVGARLLRLAPDRHDELVARTSHLPHVLAAHLARYVLDAGAQPEQKMLCAGGFRDSTRIAAGSPEMWRDIVMMNKAQVAAALGDFSQALAEFQARLERNDPAEIEQFFQQARALRESWGAPCAANSPE